MNLAASVIDDTDDTAVPGTVRYVEHAMGMPINLALRGRHIDDRKAKAAWAEVMRQLREIDETFSTFKPNSFISRLNRSDITLHDCPPEVAEVLALGERARRESGGAFNIHLPGPDGKLMLDPNGVVKGWAVDKASATLAALPATDFCLSVGGDMTCRTLEDANPPWRVGIEDPADPGRVLAVVPIHNGGVATSGTARREQHLQDARTGGRPAVVASVTVVAPTVTWADIDASTGYVLGRNAAEWLATRPGRSAVVVWNDGTITTVAHHL